MHEYTMADATQQHPDPGLDSYFQQNIYSQYQHKMVQALLAAKVSYCLASPNLLDMALLHLIASPTDILQRVGKCCIRSSQL